MDLGLKNQVAVVTGGMLGIGLAAAKVLAREGATVVVCGRSQDKLDAALASAQSEGITAEVLEISGGAFQVRDPGFSWDKK